MERFSKLGRVRNRRKNGDLQNYNIVKIGEHTEKSPGDLSRLTITQNSVQDNQLKLVLETRKNYNSNNYINDDNNNTSDATK